MKTLLLAGLLLPSLSWGEVKIPGVPPQQEVMASDFEHRSSLKHWDLKRLVAPYSVQISSENPRSGQKSLRFELRENERVSDGYRTEVRDPYFAPIGQTTWYFFSFFVPEHFPMTSTSSCVFAQWHDQKDPGDLDRNPPIAIRLRGTGQLHITGRHHARKIQNGASNPEILLYEDTNFRRGEWNDILMEVKWSFKKDGLVRIWRNGQLITNYNGPIGYNDDKGPYFKMGIYCRETPVQPLVSYHDNYRRAPTFEGLRLKQK